jgi:hypothetical protein
MSKIASKLASLDRAHGTEADIFKMALERDLIGPADFRT